MKLIDGKLFIEFSELVDCGVSSNTILKAKERQSNSWDFIEDPTDRRKILISYEDLRDNYKEQIQKRYNNPYEYIAKQPIKKLVQKDHEAEKFYLSHEFDGIKKLPGEKVVAYTTAASWLNMLIKYKDDSRFIRKTLGLKMDEFWKNVGEIIKADKIELPSSYRRLAVNSDCAIKTYQSQGYISLISEKFGNKNASKVYDDHISSNLLLELLANPQQFDDVYISQRYNSFAIENSLKTITDATVGVWRKEKEYLIMMQREGNAAFNEKYNRSIPGKRPSAPLYLVEHDDNHLDFLFIDADDKGSGKYFHRYKAIVVVDSFNDLVLGYAYSENLTTEVVYAAYANAMHYIQHLTGSYCFPFEIKSDRWAKTALTPFYNKLGNYYDTPKGSKHRGYIEQFFRTPHWKRCQKLSAATTGNYTGNNMTAKFRGVNMEHLDANMKNRPQIGHQAFTQIEQFFHRLRHMPQTNGLSKEQEWLNAWNTLPADKKKPVNEEQLLYTVGIEHKPKNGTLPRISNEGLHVTISGFDYLFNVPTELRMQYTGRPVSVLYDPFDMSRVLLTDNDKLRFVAYNQERLTKAMQDHYEGSRSYLNSILSEKLGDVNSVVAAKEKRQAALSSYGVDANDILLSSVVVKEVKQIAETRALQNDNFNIKRLDWIDSETDFSQYKQQ